jgi:hypothetical protein
LLPSPVLDSRDVDMRERGRSPPRDGGGFVMLNYIRYTLAALCLAASVGCLALWWRSITTYDSVAGPILSGDKAFLLTSDRGAG